MITEQQWHIKTKLIIIFSSAAELTDEISETLVFESDLTF